MKMRLKYYACLISLLGFQSQLYAEGNTLIYKDYMFVPDYSNSGVHENKSVNEIFESTYGNYWLTTNVKNSVTVGSSEFIVGYIDMNRAHATEFNNIGVDLYRKKDKKGQAEHQRKIEGGGRHVLAKIMDKNLKEITRETRGAGFYSNGHGAFDYLYCVENKPLFTAPLFKSKPYIMHVTSMGDAKQPGEGFDYIKLSVYDPDNENLLLAIPLMLANYQALKAEEPNRLNLQYYFPASGYRSGLNPALNLTIKPPLKNNESEGRKHYAKIFVRDFDKNNKLDIVIWYREYASARRDDTAKKGFYLDKQYFEWYEENATSAGLNQRTLTVDEGRQLLNQHELAWKDGWPNKNMCEQPYKQLPYMAFIKDDEIDEPMGKIFEYGY